MRYDHFSMLPEKAFQPRSGGRSMTLEGGGSAPKQPTSTSQTTIPEYAQPYMERLLGKAEAATEAPYQLYPGERLAQATPEQLAARGEVAGLQTPGAFGTGEQMAGLAGLQALQAGQYQPGQFNATLAQGPQLRSFQARGPGEVGGGMGSFTGEGTAGQFMSPYMQNVVDVQKQAATREAQMAQQQANLGAARQGTYGGARQTLAQAERERGLLDRLSNIQATGGQAAFDAAQKAFEQEQGRRLQAGLQTQQLGTQTGLANLQARLGVQELGAQQGMQAQLANQQALLEAQRLAEQSRQFGGTLGMQGAQTAAQAGATLGQLGAARQQSDLARLEAQERFGQLPRSEQQQALDLAYQDFIAQQQYPYSQLGFMSDILRGSGNLAATGGKAIYETPQSSTQQLLQLGLGGLGLYKAFG